MVKPNFICIGVQKSGTTSLINYLSLHPEIYMKNVECHFFDREKGKHITNRDIIEYEKLFVTNKKIIGEKTPSYNYLPFAMDRIYMYNPNIKLILLLREPISRAFSQYNMVLNFMGKTLNDVNEEEILKGFEKEEHLKFSELTCNGNYYILRGFYDEIIEYIYSKFPKENLYIGISEEIKSDKWNEYNKIINFLGAKETDDIKKGHDTHVRIYNKEMPKCLSKKLYNIYKPHNERLYQLLGRKIDAWEEYYNTLDLM